MIRLLYNVLYSIFFIVTFPYYFLRLWRRGNWRGGMGQRFGVYDAAITKELAGQQVIWFHAVSVGEVNLCALLVKAFGDELRDWQIVVSTTTTTGMGELRRKLPSEILKVYYPLDFSFSVNRALRVFHPSVVVLVEAEIWPNFLWQLERQSIPAYLINARLSDRSAHRYQQFGWLFRSMFASFTGVGVQNAHDAELLARVGCLTDRVRVTGNLKFDAVDLTSTHHMQPRDVLAWAGATDEALVLLASSTHAGEERMIGEIYQAIRERCPQLFLVVVPRHFERGADVERELAGLGLECHRRSDYSEAASRVESGDCLIVDSTGELRFFYDCADVVFIGKSVLARGGQNPIEPAAVGCAVVMGPHMENFRAIVKSFLDADGTVQVADVGELRATLERLLGDSDLRESLGRNARSVVDRNRGAVQRSVEMILETLHPSS